MSHSNKRKRKNANGQLPAAKRLKSNRSRPDMDDKSCFPFDTAKPVDKIIPLGQGKKQRLRIKNREQSIRLKHKSKEIERLQSRISNSCKSYDHYHRLLLTFANGFDQMFIALHQHLTPNDAVPLCLVLLSLSFNQSINLIVVHGVSVVSPSVSTNRSKEGHAIVGERAPGKTRQ